MVRSMNFDLKGLPASIFLFNNFQTEIDLNPIVPAANKAASFKRPYRNCSTTRTCASHHFCFGAVPIGIYRFPVLIREANWNSVPLAAEQCVLSNPRCRVR
jgi:hypothetical protein